MQGTLPANLSIPSNIQAVADRSIEMRRSGSWDELARSYIVMPIFLCAASALDALNQAYQGMVTLVALAVRYTIRLITMPVGEVDPKSLSWATVDLLEVRVKTMFALLGLTPVIPLIAAWSPSKALDYLPDGAKQPKQRLLTYS